ncbi:Vesicle-associated membrane protein-associated protein A [Penicillium maclennaniae]|uniref:Vesicle-associated membrane protein-associated protein A n=1 Tax=Penicillium maclennaniae TaxID=1343394 RepID=UPI0025415CBB|nr:Vesicle-associated membrane protein-associated protein A [Penicillium maclennaniae]KAJ5665742.1 Vesicle-associated membrane protein-associated protein A [Penicillium maclennaniae]
MSVEVDPPELGFKRPFNQEICQVLHLRNPGQEAVVFKVRLHSRLRVKTTAPKHYCVRPNSGRVEPGKTVEVQVLLQAMKEEPPADAKCKDKFLVQSVAVGRDMEFSNVTAIFEKTSKSAVIEKKIRVNWLRSDANLAADSSKLGANDSVLEGEPPTYTSPGGNFETPAPGKKNPCRASIAHPSPDFSEKTKSESESPGPSEPVGAFANAKAAVIGAMPSSDELKAQLADANAQIQRLKDRLADQGLRQRKTGGEAPAALLL